MAPALRPSVGEVPPASEHGQVMGDIMDMLRVKGIKLFKFS